MKTDDSCLLNVFQQTHEEKEIYIIQQMCSNILPENEMGN